ncbi:MAG: RING finger domain-containing protein [Nitrososphaerota archaeon]
MQTVKFVYSSISINNNVVPIYIPKYGIIVDDITKAIIYRFPTREVDTYFYFKLEFDKYKYKNSYQPKTGTYKNRVWKKVYRLVLYINMYNIMHNEDFFTSDVSRKLTKYISYLQINEMLRRRTYHVNPENICSFGEQFFPRKFGSLRDDFLKGIKDFISNREKNYIYFIPWYHFRINDDYIFDLHLGKVRPFEQTKKINFSKKGGIIETDNVREIIHHFFSGRNLIVLPANMDKLWENSDKITYDQLITFSEKDLDKWDGKKYDRIIIHECHNQFLVGIKELVRRLDCQVIWVINSLPLKYYLSMDGCSKLGISEISTISNLWIGFGINEKRIYKTELVRLFLTNFGQYYLQVRYFRSQIVEVLNPRMGCVLKINSSPFERKIYSKYKLYFLSWIDNLTNNPNNVYSMADRCKIVKVEANILNAVFILILSVVRRKNVGKFFKTQLKEALKLMNEHKMQLEKSIENCDQLKSCEYLVEEFGIFENFREKRDKVEKAISNYERYLLFGSAELPFRCPICYESSDLIQVQLICGHHICLDCILDTLARKNECPICKEFVSIRQVAIIEESIPNYQPNISRFIKYPGEDTIILTDLNFGDVLRKKQSKVINVERGNFIKNVSRIKSVRKIMVVGSKNFVEKYNHFLEFFGLFNNPPSIEWREILF